ncbi:MAG: acetyl-CoA carboxylase biotin carboxylase subunit [Phycisphaerae bacterium]|nr:acetyl-CoA carboxylase biotin carboxylase subunit [Phycisphaerae bacterium]MCZ2401278.1 acetyl-CoA carboxylase biotin carboxylase subunit [Phycisphaerae bacterium]NUQ50940.1 acetyl-CoA carboxylase biotin carboxylase subunit [Phycisphaerae bacterium]
MFHRILVANRGEIALRIIRACRDLGIEAVAVYSRADRDAAYLNLAHDAICIGKEPSAQSYLNPAAIISAAEIADVEAIHPGYGFLSENPTFARMCRDCRIEFIGPSAEAMLAMGNKVEARRIAKQARVPLVPGSDGAVENEEEAVNIARKIGYPVMIKASAGGGGRGIRPAHNEASLRSGFRNAQAEAEAAFKDGTLYVEKLIERPRHVEVQILGDAKGHLIHLWERDCSLQRRNQKLIEESPSPHISRRTRAKLCLSAVRLAKVAGYHSAGTCEFLVDANENFYFMEMNARIQVEHPVTELVTGIDLVQWQIRIAAGEPLSIKQDAVQQNGAALECRINAESPDDNFRPSPGRILEFIAPGGPGVRLDTHAYAGYNVPPNYDSMIAKLLVHRPTREEAFRAMRRALSEFVIGPIKTTIPLHRKLLEHTEFIAGNVDTGFVERVFAPGANRAAAAG